MTPLTLRVLPERLAICRLPAEATVPAWARGRFLAVTRTPTELSLVCAQADVPAGQQAERGWVALQVAGPLDFGLTGVLAALAVPLAEAEVSIFAISTYDTDYVLVREAQLATAVAALAAAGHRLA